MRKNNNNHSTLELSQQCSVSTLIRMCCETVNKKIQFRTIKGKKKANKQFHIRQWFNGIHAYNDNRIYEREKHLTKILININMQKIAISSSRSLAFFFFSSLACTLFLSFSCRMKFQFDRTRKALLERITFIPSAAVAVSYQSHQASLCLSLDVRRSNFCRGLAGTSTIADNMRCAHTINYVILVCKRTTSSSSSSTAAAAVATLCQYNVYAQTVRCVCTVQQNLLNCFTYYIRLDVLKFIWSVSCTRDRNTMRWARSITDDNCPEFLC